MSAACIPSPNKIGFERLRTSLVQACKHLTELLFGAAPPVAYSIWVASEQELDAAISKLRVLLFKDKDDVIPGWFNPRTGQYAFSVEGTRLPAELLATASRQLGQSPQCLPLQQARSLGQPRSIIEAEDSE